MAVQTGIQEPYLCFWLYSELGLAVGWKKVACFGTALLACVILHAIEISMGLPC